MTRIFSLGFLPLSLMLSVLTSTQVVMAEQPDRPNVLLIVSDDQGYNDLGVLNSEIITPNLDRLAKEGTRLTNFYVSWPACTPSRASLLTGRYPQRNGIYDMIRNEAPDYGYKYRPAEYEVTFERIGGMDLREKILPAYLAELGYQSAIFGKWDLGTLKRFLPTSRGFDQFYGFVNTGIDYYTHERYGVPSMYRNLTKTESDRGTYATGLFRREALRFLHEVESATPFLLYLPFNAPHNSSALESEIRTTVQAPKKYQDMYPPVKEEYQIRKNYRGQENAKVVSREARQRDYRAAVTCMDEAIGEVIDLLTKQGRLDNTLIIFLSDNGGSGGADNSPLRGHKAQMWEGGIRVPCLIRWPEGGVPAGQVHDGFLTSLDILPSILAATGAKPDPKIVLDGYDWWPNIRENAPSPRTEMYWTRRDEIAARVGNYKLVRIREQPDQLFDLENDISESNNLAKENPAMLRKLQDHLEDWQSEMQAAEPRGPFRDF